MKGGARAHEVHRLVLAGLGGFHLALGRLGHECVFASELDADLATLYKKNFEIEPAGDIREVRLRDIPAHDIPVRRLPMPAILKGMAGNEACNALSGAT